MATSVTQDIGVPQSKIDAQLSKAYYRPGGYQGAEKLRDTLRKEVGPLETPSIARIRNPICGSRTS